MFAVRDTRTGKFLRRFSDSFNRKRSDTFWGLRNKGLGLTDAEVNQKTDEALWSADTVNEAKLYASHRAIKHSFYARPLKDYHEIVPVQIV